MSDIEYTALQACQAGDTSQFAVLYDYYFDKIYAFIYRQVQNRETSEDLTSQTFFQALDKISTYNPDKGSFSSWLYRIARNTTHSHYRRHRYTQDIESLHDLASRSNVAEEAEQHRQLDLVRQHLSSLTPDQQEIIRLRLWEELSYEEIGEILHKSPASCRMSFSRAIHLLRSQLTYLMLSLLISFL